MDVRWGVCWEGDVVPAEHRALAALIARYYPDRAEEFRDERSWYSARPELRVVGYLDDRPVAHLGVLRRFLHTRDRDVLVGDVGLVGTDPTLHGTGLGRALLAHTRETLDELGVPFGFLTCLPPVVGYYEACGWKRVPGQRTRMIGRGGAVEEYDGPAMMLPVRSVLAEWPPGVVDRNGYEV